MPDLPRPARRFSFPPRLNLRPVQRLPKLVDHYLTAVLHEVLYSSLLAENQRRLLHMDGAMRRIENDLAQLKTRYNALRQEEIIEEIEVILLSAEAVAADT
jgi:F-type H+-transporting ATPase subunit gamma